MIGAFVRRSYKYIQILATAGQMDCANRGDGIGAEHRAISSTLTGRVGSELSKLRLHKVDDDQRKVQSGDHLPLRHVCTSN